MILRQATRADLPVLRRWDREPHVIAAGSLDDGLDWERELARQVDWQEILIAEEAGRPIGVLLVIDPEREETRFWGEIEPGLRAIDIWIGDAADLGRGFGTAMMRLALARCFGDPSVRAVLVDPLAGNVRAQRFYEKLGFRRDDRRYFDDDDCIVYRLDRPGGS